MYPEESRIAHLLRQEIGPNGVGQLRVSLGDGHFGMSGSFESSGRKIDLRAVPREVLDLMEEPLYKWSKSDPKGPVYYAVVDALPNGLVSFKYW
jgi:hypothetical protein